MASDDAISHSNHSDQSNQLPFVVAITGASGAIYGMRLVQFLMEVNQPVDLLMSKAALRVVKEEHDLVFGEDFKAGLLKHLQLPDTVPLRTHSLTDYGASVASGSYRTRGMAVVPCSLGTLGAIASGLTENLIHRAAAVTLKERRTLLILVREMPFGLIQLRNMVTVTEAGGVVACASPGFYHRPQSVEDQIDFVVGRVLDQFNFDNRLFKRWKEDSRPIYQASKRS
ncbi:MAG: flavin prenyltransferase UbiX [Candidatus Melainabacteria bacterium]|nr:flavin prenyltransferase UbiX [Candidatus Melainabacteria bacterium]